MNMQSMSMIKYVLFGVLAATVMQGCALDGETPDDPENENAQNAQTDPQALDEQDAEAADSDAADAATDATDPMILATPTCNGVRNWFSAAVPDWTPSGTVDCNMVRGTNSEAVRQLQRSMNICYHEQLKEDGDFGGLTQQALIRTQRTAGTPADGQYGPNTRKAMRHESNEVPRTCTRVP